MVFVIAQLSDVRGPHRGSGERFSAALDEINGMARQPDLVLLTGDNTHNSADDEWRQVKDRLAVLGAPWIAINGNHDRTITETAGHRALNAGPSSSGGQDPVGSWTSTAATSRIPRPVRSCMSTTLSIDVAWIDVARR